MSDNGKGSVLRIAIRGEGHVVRVYLAEVDTMVDARLIASVAAAAIVDEEVFEAFKDFVKLAVRKLAEQEGATINDIIEQSVAEHERAGHA